MITVGGALLLTPGFITDIFGLVLLIPPSRAVVRGLLPASSPAASRSPAAPRAGATSACGAAAAPDRARRPAPPGPPAAGPTTSRARRRMSPRTAPRAPAPGRSAATLPRSHPRERIRPGRRAAGHLRLGAAGTVRARLRRRPPPRRRSARRRAERGRRSGSARGRDDRGDHPHGLPGARRRPPRRRRGGDRLPGRAQRRGLAPPSPARHADGASPSSSPTAACWRSRRSRPGGAGDHAAEEVRAALAEPSGEQTNFEEALLSTEFDADGRHRRATLELTPAGDDLRDADARRRHRRLRHQRRGRRPPPRGRLLPLGPGGRPGLGRYEIVTPL